MASSKSENPDSRHGGELARRIERLQEELKKRKLDAMIVYDRFNAYYLTGFRASLSYLLVTSRSARLLIDGRYIESARNAVKHCEVVLFKKIGKSLEAWRREFSPRRIGLEGTIPKNQWDQFGKFIPNVEWAEAGEAILAQRLIKSPFEVQRIAASAELNDAICEKAFAFAQPGKTERDVRNFIREHVNSSDAEAESFDCIVATGAAASMPHYRPGLNTIQAGDLLLIDMGMLLGGYCSDMTRASAIGGDPKPRMRKVFDAVLEAEEAALKQVAPGVKASDLHKTAVATLKKRGLAKYFTHGLGHGVGLEIHEAPTLNAVSTDVLRPGMIITIEPGVYIPGVGGVRIEDLVVVTRRGYRVLSRAPKEFRVIGAKA